MAGSLAAFLPASGGHGAKEDPTLAGYSFLQKAAEVQQAEIALGRMATERARNPEVRQFGTQMTEDHQRASANIQQLASKEGIPLPTELTARHRDKKEEFARLSGVDFDRAYIGYMLRDHRKDLKEFERNVKAIKDHRLQQWAESTLPMLKQHLRQAQQIAAVIGVDATARP